MFGDEGPEEVDALGVVEDDDLGPVRRHPFMAAGEVRDSPTTTAPIWNWRTSPLQYQHGERVVTMTQSA
jgi:hypothetical protein